MITVLIPTSPIPSHPSTAILDETIANVRKYTHAKILILFDGVHESVEHRRIDYQQYKNAVLKNIEDGFYGECGYIIFSEHTHQARMTRIAMEFVITPLILFCEHDTSPINEIPFELICDLVRDSDTINYMRFNIFHMILPEHMELMIGAEEKNGIKYTRTIQWSQRPHIAKSDWYRRILNDHFAPSHKTMIEDVMHSVVQCAYHAGGRDAFGLSIYTPAGNQLRSYHSDGRKDDYKIVEA